MQYSVDYERVYPNRTIRADQPVKALDYTHAEKIFKHWVHNKYKTAFINIIGIYEKKTETTEATTWPGN